jgi:hypothetical protein
MPAAAERRRLPADCPCIMEGRSMSFRISLDLWLWLAAAVNLAVTAALYAKPIASFG